MIAHTGIFSCICGVGVINGACEPIMTLMVVMWMRSDQGQDNTNMLTTFVSIEDGPQPWSLFPVNIIHIAVYHVIFPRAQQCYQCNNTPEAEPPSILAAPSRLIS